MPLRLAELTTLRLGGPARRLVPARTDTELVDTVREADRAGEPLLVLAGGSNVVIPDEGFDGTVVLVRTRGVARRPVGGQAVALEVAAGESWDAVVAGCVAGGLAGVECLAGIPGSTGATPIQNVGAYGQEVAETIVRVRVYDRRRDAVEELAGDECGFAYRSSAFKRDPEHRVVLGVTFRLDRATVSRPIRYQQLADALGVALGEAAPLDGVRDAVLALRRSKGMVIDPDDPDTASAGSFFMNPSLDAAAFDAVVARARSRLGEGVQVPHWPQDDGTVKTSAAWLIEHAGFHRGYGDPDGIAISSKHTLALTNRGRGTTAELLRLAAEIRDGVRAAYGVELEPEPRLVASPRPSAR